MNHDTRSSVLIVDDCVENLQLMSGILRDNYIVLAAKSGIQAIKIAKKSKPDIILLDVMMPEMDGYETCCKMKQSKELRGIPVIFVTALTDPEDEVRGFNAGGVDYITKPVSPPTVLARVATHLQLKSTETQLREILNKTLSGAVGLLMDLLTLANPAAFSRATRLKRFVRMIGQHMPQPGFWQIELAAMFSQVGSLGLSPDLLFKIHSGRSMAEDEMALYETHSKKGGDLIGRIPQLENVAAIITQHCTTDAADKENKDTYPPIVDLGARILRLVVEYDRHITMGMDPATAMGFIKANSTEDTLPIIEAFEQGMSTAAQVLTPHQCYAFSLQPGYVLQVDVLSKCGKLLLTAGTELSVPMIKSLQSLASNKKIVEPLSVLAHD